MDAIIAALPDPLPRTIHVWVTDIDSTGTAPVAVRLQFGARRDLKINIAQPGSSCGPRARTESRTLPVVAVTRTRGASVEVFDVLARRPHIPILRDATGCIAFGAGATLPP